VAASGGLNEDTSGNTLRIADNDTDMTDFLSKSLVYIEVSAYVYDVRRPWRSADTITRSGYGCVVDDNRVLTTAWNVSDAALIKIRKYAHNEFIKAEVEYVDYECNLSVLKLDSGSEHLDLEPISFSKEFTEGKALMSYWLSKNGHVTSARGYLDRAQVHPSTVSYNKMLNYIVSNTSQKQGRGRLYCSKRKAVGIACWADTEKQEVGLIPGEVINIFLENTYRDKFRNVATVGFSTSKLLDPVMRKYLNLPIDLKHGVLVSGVYNLGTGSDILSKHDVITAINGNIINPYGRYNNRIYGKLALEHIVNTSVVGDNIKFTIFRDGVKINLESSASSFGGSDMLVPHYFYDRRPRYLVRGGFVFQPLTLDYLMIYGDNWQGKAPPHLFNYLTNFSYRPTEERKEIIILSYVLPSPVNLGYQDLGQLVVESCNGKKVGSLEDLYNLLYSTEGNKKFDVIEFEKNSPTAVIPRQNIEQVDAMIQQGYRIPELTNINP
jgi:S1-C subfamily serine protease